MKLYKNKVAIQNPHNSLITIEELNFGYFWNYTKLSVRNIVENISPYTICSEPRRFIEPTDTLEYLWTM